jgi:hypothetical protein
LLEVSGAVVASVAWAFLMPGSPIVPYIDDPAMSAIIPALIGFIAVCINLVIAALLKNRAAAPSS